MSTQTAAASSTQYADPSAFSGLLDREFKPKGEQQREAVEAAVRTLAEQALGNTVTMSDDAYASIEAIIAEIDAKLTQWLTQLQGTAHQRADNLAQRLSGSAGTGATQAAEVSDFLLLQILNRFEPQLDHLLRVQETSPEVAYTLLRSMAGELSTFVRTQTRRPATVPAYQHRDPYTSFKQLVEDTRELLNNLLVRSAQSIALQAKPHGMYLASLDPTELKGFSGLVLAVAASMPTDQLAQLFPAHSKLAPADRLPELVRLHLPGIVLRVLPVPPRQIPFNAGYVYFQVEPQGAMWEHMQTHGGIALHIATQFSGLRMELWGVR